MEVRHMSKLATSLVGVVLSCVLLGCSINVKKNGDDAEKKVDIDTPIGGIHVSKEADPRAIGLDVYPGAKPVEKEEDGQEKSANVNISTSFFGIKVVAQEYQSDATPDKLIDYYTRDLKKYGSVLQCHASWRGNHADVNHSGDKSKQLKCEESSGDATELKVGTEDNQHIVSIAPQGKGSKFALVVVQIRGKEDTI
jgi:hypothetical protein